MRHGIIVEYDRAEKSYIVRVDSQTTVNLPFEECGSQRFRTGDVIDFDLKETEHYGSYAKDPILSHNVHFDYLESISGTDTIIEGQIIGVKEFGYHVNFYGYICYLPASETMVKRLSRDMIERIIHDVKKFSVKKVRDGCIYISANKGLREQFEIVKQKEMQNLFVGFHFEGTIVHTCDFGVWVRNIFSEGLIHRSFFLNNYTSQKEFLRIHGNQFKDLFPIGSKLAVEIDQMFETKYSLKIVASKL